MTYDDESEILFILSRNIDKLNMQNKKLNEENKKLIMRVSNLERTSKITKVYIEDIRKILKVKK